MTLQKFPGRLCLQMACGSLCRGEQHMLGGFQGRYKDVGVHLKLPECAFVPSLLTLR